MIPASTNQLLTANTGYRISRSLRFRSSASAYLSRTYSSAPSNNKIFTASLWVKRGTLGANLAVFSGYDGTSGNAGRLEFLSGDTLNWQFGGSTANNITTTQVFRDPSAWYHIVVSVDTTQATSTNRQKLYVNGAQVTALSTANYPAQNAASQIMYANANNNIGSGLGNIYLDGYLAEVNFIDGQALTPSSFGAFDTNGVWQPIACTVSDYGKNGFYLPFSDSANIFNDKAAIATNHSAANNWTNNNLQVATSTATTYDYMIDSPTNYADGGNGRGNYAVLNPVGSSASSMLTISDGNLTVTAPGSASNFGKAGSSLAVSSGKWYFEVTIGALDTNNWQISVAGTPPIQDTSNQNGLLSGEVCYNPKNSSNVEMIYNNGTTTYTNTVAASVNQVIGVAFDADNRTVQFYRQNTAVSTAQTINSASVYYISLIARNTGTASIHYANFGQRPFTYTPPSGFSALNTQNLPTPTIAAGNKFFDATTYTGNGTSSSSTQTITNGGFQPDLVWVKSRSTADYHNLVDSVRGISTSSPNLFTNTTSAETVFANVGITAVSSTGFTLLANGSYTNANGTSYIGWQWNAGGAPTTDNVAGAGNVPTAGSVKINGANSTSALAGSIAATRLSANTSAGFSVVTWTGTGATGTIGHGLGATPGMIIVKSRSAIDDWYVYHSSLGATQRVQLNQTAAVISGTTVWNSTSPTSNVFSIGNGNPNSSSVTYVAYCFAPVAGYSAFGSYGGNGSTDGPFVYCGFRPRYVLFKDITTASREWIIQDTSRQTYNNAPNNAYNLSADSSAAENDATVLGGPANANNIDFLSNGFKLKYNNANCNASGDTYIYAAFAENPLKFARAR